MTCDRYRPLLALLVGNDLDPREVAEVRQHLSGCAYCQSQWKSFEKTTQVLQSVSQQTVAPVSGSLWPELSKRVGGRTTVAREPAPGWMTVGAFSAACAAVLWLTVSTPVFDFDFADTPLAELESDPFSAPQSMGGQFPPQLQFVNDTQPAIPLEFTPAGNSQVHSPLQVPSRMLGEPRSF